LVFGGAPVINTFTSLILARTVDQVGAFFLAGLIMVVIGAVTVLVFAPKGQPHGHASPPPKPVPAPPETAKT
jgi:hypothetical protein